MATDVKSRAVESIGIGIDTARYGHCAWFLRDDEQPAAKVLEFRETRAGYVELEQRIAELRRRYPEAQLRVRIDAAGQYARNLENFLRSLPEALSISVGEPQRNHHYRMAHQPKNKSDRTEAFTMARYAVKEQPAPSFALDPQFVALQMLASRLQGAARDLTRCVNRFHGLMSNVFPELAIVQKDLTAGWVLALLDKWPTPEQIVQAGLARLKKVAGLRDEKAELVWQAAKSTVGSLRGSAVAPLVELMVQELRHTKSTKESLENLLVEAYRNLPPGNYRLLESIPGIGEVTAAILTSKIIDIQRFATPVQLVGYFGVFPEKVDSGVDPDGKPHAANKQRMSKKGNDLVRGYLWMSALSAIQHNPPVRAKYARQMATGQHGNVALGHAMQKLLHQVWAIWRSGKEFDAEYESTRRPPASTVPPTEAEDQTKMAAGLTRELSPTMPEVTAAPVTVSGAAAPVKDAQAAEPRSIDFAHVRSQLRIESVLELLNHRQQLHSEGKQLRGPCLFHKSRKKKPRQFSVHPEKNLFQCFAPECQAKGNALDLYAQATQLPVHEAAWQLVEILHLEPTRNRERNP